MERTQQARETENHDSIVSHTLWLSVMVQSQALEGLGRGGVMILTCAVAPGLWPRCYEPPRRLLQEPRPKVTVVWARRAAVVQGVRVWSWSEGRPCRICWQIGCEKWQEKKSRRAPSCWSRPLERACPQLTNSSQQTCYHTHFTDENTEA